MCPDLLDMCGVFENAKKLKIIFDTLWTTVHCEKEYFQFNCFKSGGPSQICLLLRKKIVCDRIRPFDLTVQSRKPYPLHHQTLLTNVCFFGLL